MTNDETRGGREVPAAAPDRDWADGDPIETELIETGRMGTEWGDLLRSEELWVSAPTELLARIGAELGIDVSTADEVARLTPQRARRRVGWRTALAVAASVAVVFCAGLLVGGSGNDSGEAAAPANDPPMAHLTLTGTDRAPAATAEVDVFDRGAGYALILDTTGLAPAPDGSFYQGWLRSRGGDEISVGTFHMRGGDDTVVLWSGVSVDLYPTLVITVTTAADATAGGVDAAVVMVGTLPTV